ncbi:Ger(x)C family spore germination protein [Paenisporosarcina sp. TG20]|uniref:Ger(x)C family spore germination protein n=1 Tax=Paenisporosarcina sp. TG20 TaxID=1211706 RepID=UPI000308937B|nr:Ger(x)C family spore germination protein [Paenisporosarcina sp. TG20]
MKKNIICIIISSLLLGGCTEIVQTPLEDLGLISVAAFDYVDEKKMKMTVIMPQSAEDAKNPTQVYSVETELVQKGLVEISSKSDSTAALNQLRVVLFSEEMAKTDQMHKVIEYLYNNPKVTTRTFVAVVKDSAGKLLESEYPDKANKSIYMNNFFNKRQNVLFNPFKNIHDLIYDLHNPLVDPVVVYVELKESLINIDGIAVFKDKKMVDIFTREDAKSLQLLLETNKISSLSFVIDLDLAEEKIFMNFLRVKTKITSNHDIESPKLNISMKLSGQLSEYEGKKDLGNKSEVAKLEKEIEKAVEDDMKEFLQKCQELSVDPIGLFESFRMRYKGDWPSDLKDELLAKAEFEVDVKLDITTSGAITKK